jgi:hypothetical protein
MVGIKRTSRVCRRSKNKTLVADDGSHKELRSYTFKVQSSQYGNRSHLSVIELVFSVLGKYGNQI